MRADRLLSILLQLQMNRRLTARELAGRLEVSERTILRDMDALGAAGVPVVAERGVGGGWALVEAYRTSLKGMSEAEVRALFFTQSMQMLSALGFRDAAGSAETKLPATAHLPSRQDAEHAPPRYAATVRIEANRFERLGNLCFVRIEHVGETGEDGWRTADIVFESELEACEAVLSFGPLIEVLAPEALRARVRHLAEATLARYARSVSSEFSMQSSE